MASLLMVLFFVVLAEFGARCIYFHTLTRESFALKYFVKNMQKKREAAKLPVPVEWDDYIRDPGQIRSLYPYFLKDGVAFGNSPFDGLRNPRTEEQYVDAAGITRNKPSSHYFVSQIRDCAGNQWDPYLYKDSFPDGAKSPETRNFLSRYGLAPKHAHTDENGNRVTLPASNSKDLVLIFGDSVAYGAGVADDETLASALQVKYPRYKFINYGVAHATAPENMRYLTEALGKYKDAVKGVIYVNTEGAWRNGSTPSYIVDNLDRILNENRVPCRILINTQYIYTLLPELVRPANEAELRKFFQLRKEVLGLAGGKGMKTVDLYDLVDDYKVRMGTSYAGFAFFIDHSHLSLFGARTVADKVRLP